MCNNNKTRKTKTTRTTNITTTTSNNTANIINSLSSLKDSFNNNNNKYLRRNQQHTTLLSTTTTTTTPIIKTMGRKSNNKQHHGGHTTMMATGGGGTKSSTGGHGHNNNKHLLLSAIQGADVEKATRIPDTTVGHTTSDILFVGNCFCCDSCLWAPINPRFNEPTTNNSKPKSKQFLVQLKQNLFFYLTIIILFAMNFCVIWFDGLYLAKHIHLSVLIISQVLFTIVVLSLWITACTDPGILPPAVEDEAVQIEHEYSKNINFFVYKFVLLIKFLF